MFCSAENTVSIYYKCSSYQCFLSHDSTVLGSNPGNDFVKTDACIHTKLLAVLGHCTWTDNYNSTDLNKGISTLLLNDSSSVRTYPINYWVASPVSTDNRNTWDFAVCWSELLETTGQNVYALLKTKKKIYCRSQEAGGNVHDKLHYFHYITPLIRIWIYSFKVTVKAFGSSEFPLWKKPTSHSSLAHWKPVNLVCNNMRWHYDFCTHLSPLGEYLWWKNMAFFYFFCHL